MSPDPIACPEDRFPFGLPGRWVPVTGEAPTRMRPWGMGQARRPLPVRSFGQHEKPTSTKTEKVPTQHTDDGKVKPDEYTQTVTD